ncbi:unnamed protein product [Soboliphyme baturini]|uniref:Uncharacterized protein n=1 Tax=Soboliphyme baturini TaxID=241478 RepID=A0A183IAV9_9BILA|nr:unnamed protein product [Soboliphyme baturini]
MLTAAGISTGKTCLIFGAGCFLPENGEEMQEVQRWAFFLVRSEGHGSPSATKAPERRRGQTRANGQAANKDQLLIHVVPASISADTSNCNAINCWQRQRPTPQV